MHIYAAGGWVEHKIRYKKRLYTYANGWKDVWSNIDELLRAVERPRVLIDSGAFTVWNSGGYIDLEEYIEFIGETKRRYASRLEALHFISLDVIGNPEKTRENHERIVKFHPDVLPVVTRGAGKRDVEWALEIGDYIAVGGLVFSADGGHQDIVFAEAMRRWKRTGKMKKVHLLGITTLDKLLKYPVYSSDSTSYISPGKFGSGVMRERVPSKKRFGKVATMIRDAEIRAYLEIYKKMERRHAEIWCRRGICWED